MTTVQRSALAALIHSPAARRNSRWERRNRAGDIAWATVLALLLALSASSLVEGLRYVCGADALQTMAATRPHVDASVAPTPLEAPSAVASVAVPAPRATRPAALARRSQSSGVVRRTM